MIFRKSGGGKSTLAKRISKELGIALHPLDLIEFEPTGGKVPEDEFRAAHGAILNQESWVIEGLGQLITFWDRVDAADTLVYVDLPYSTHYCWVIKRIVRSFFKRPEGWPEGSSVWKGSLSSLRMLRRSPSFWNEVLLTRIRARAECKHIIHVRNASELGSVLGALESQHSAWQQEGDAV